MARTEFANGTLYRSDRAESVYIITATVASGTLVPTQAELDASTTYNVTAAIDTVTGFMSSRPSLEVAIKGTSSFPVRLSGPPSVGDSSITFWADKLGVDIKSILDPSDIVYVVFAPNGDTAASYLECWKCEVTNLSREKQFGGEAARVTVTFDVQNANERALIPA